MSKKIKQIYALFIGAMISAVIHNLIYVFLHTEEAIFFFAALILFLGFIIMIIYNFITYLTKNKPKDIYNLKWLGLIGFLGFALNPPIQSVFFGFFIFLLLFFLKPLKSHKE